jgi:hypothetical protein
MIVGCKDRETYIKLTCALEQASKDGLEYFWINNMWIDKTRRVALLEAINAMSN